MTLLLRRRARELREAMDDPWCDARRLRATYARFALVNRWLTGWQRVYRRWLRPRVGRGASLLDVGCGGGDLARQLAAWSAADGAPLRVTAIDPDPRALAFAREHAGGAPVELRCAGIEELVAEGRHFDIVVSNHVLHHLDEDELPAFLATSARLARRAVVHNDLCRHDLALLAFAPLRLAFPRSFIVPDGLRSIRRAYRPAELRRLVPAGWTVARGAPFRTLAMRLVDGESGR